MNRPSSDYAPANSTDVVLHLAALTRELSQATAALVAADRDATLKRHAADLAEARAYLAAGGTIPERERIADDNTEKSEQDARLAETLARGLKAQIRALEIRIDVGRTYGATVRAELKTLAYSEAP